MADHLNQLSQVFQATLSSEEHVRKSAETQLQQLRANPGYTTALFHLSVADTVDPNVRLASSIAFKNVVSSNWDIEDVVEGHGLISEEEKVPLRTQIPESLSSLPPLVRSQVAVALRHVIYADWPERLPNVVNLAMTEIKKQTPASLHGGLMILRLICKKYEYKTEDDKRNPFEELTVHIFPMMQDLLEHLLKLKGIESAELQRLVLKALWSSMHLALPKIFLQAEHFQRWAMLLSHVLTMPVQDCHDPPLTVHQVQDPTLAYWKVKKHAISIVVGLMERYGQPKQLKANKDKQKEFEFATVFLQHFAGPFLETCLVVIGMRAQFGWLPDRILHQALCYINECVPVSQVYKILKPHLRTLIFSVIQPILRFERENLEVWSDNPVEFVRQEYSLDEEWWAPKPQAVNLLSDLSRQRTKDTLDVYMEYCSTVLQQYAAAPDKTNFEKAAEKDGVMLGIGTILPKIIKKAKYRDVLEPLFLTFVIPEFQSQVGFLRSRACWFAGVIGGVKVSKQETHRAAVQALLASLQDKELPVRIEAAHALFDYLKQEWVIEEIKSMLGPLLETYFTLINEVGVDEVVRTLGMLVAQLESEVLPFATQIITTAAQTFVRYHEDENDEDASAMAAMECLSLIPVVLTGMTDHPEMVSSTEPVLVPMLQKGLTDSFDYLTELLQITALLTYAGASISEGLWTLYPIMVKVFDEFAWDYLEEMIPTFDNFIERGTDVFLSRPDFVQGACHVVEKVLANDESSEKDCQPACAMIESMVLNCVGRIDHLIEPFFKMVVDRMSKTKNLPLMTNLADCLGDMLYYNAKLTLQLAASQGWLEGLIAKLLELAPHYTRMYDKKVAILAFSSILKMDAASLASVQNHLPMILDRTTSLIVSLRQDKAQAGQEEEEEDEDDDVGGGWATDDELDDEDDAFNEKDLAIYEKLVADVSNHVDAWDTEADLDDIDEYESPLDKVEEGLFFLEALNVLNTTVPAFVPSLGIGAQAMLNSVVNQIQADHQQASAPQAAPAPALGFNPVMHPGSPQ